MADAMADADAIALRERLDPLLARTISPDVHVTGLARLSGGASRITWAVDARDAAGRDLPLVLQLTRPGALDTGAGIAGEAELLAAAADAHVPVARLVAADLDPAVLGAAFLLVERVEGETIARRILRDDDYADARSVLAGQCGEALAKIHRIPLDAAPSLRDVDQLTQFRAILDALGEPHPAFELAFRWLELHRPVVERRVVVHGDFRLGNLVVGPEGLRAVLDWELAHLADPHDDLGWLCVRAWRFGASAPVGGFGDYDDLFSAYHDAGGGAVDLHAFRWWQLCNTVKWGVMCVIQAAGHLSGRSRSIELAAIGRRAAEQEFDALCLVPGPPPPTGPPAGRVAATAVAADIGGAPHDRPTLGELVEALGEWLGDDVVAGTSGRLQFHARVAANVVGVIERELRLGPAHAEAHAARLRALGAADDATLAAAIRAGELDPRIEEVRAALLAAATDKLAVANPRWLENPEVTPEG